MTVRMQHVCTDLCAGGHMTVRTQQGKTFAEIVDGVFNEQAWKPTHVLPERPLHCHVCGTEEKLAYMCPEHGPRCWAHVFTHEFCSHPKTIIAPTAPTAKEHVCTGLCAGQSGQGKALHVFRRVEVERSAWRVDTMPILLMV